MNAPPTAPAIDPAARAEDEERTWAMLAHLTYFAHFLFPFGGLIGAIVVYSMRRRDVAYVRENARNALNAEIVFSAVTVLLFVTVFVALFAGMMAMPQNTSGAATPFPGPMSYYFAAWGVLAAWLLFGLISASIGARRAYLGGVFRYFCAVDFVR
jgi:uncharacterized Tic20 family protein